MLTIALRLGGHVLMEMDEEMFVALCVKWVGAPLREKAIKKQQLAEQYEMTSAARTIDRAMREWKGFADA